MSLQDTPIRRKLMAMLLLTSGTVLLLSCTAFFAYDFLTFRQNTIRELSTLGEVIAANSSDGLASRNLDQVREVLSALRAEPHVVAAGLYDEQGKLFAKHPQDLLDAVLPSAPGTDGYRFRHADLAMFLPVGQAGSQRLGTLYLKSDAGGLYERFVLYGGIVVSVMTLSFVAAYTLSRRLQKQISLPILALADTARSVSERRDYSVRASKLGQDELGLLTDAFNQMLMQIQERESALSNANQALHVEIAERKLADHKLRAQLERLDLLQQITQGIGERQDMRSIFQTVVRSLEDQLPIDFGCVGLYDAAAHTLTVTNIGGKSEALARQLALPEQARIAIDQNGLNRCVQGQLVYEPDLSQVPMPFPQRLSQAGLAAVVMAPLLVESKVFGVLVSARRQVQSFSSGECEFLRQLSEHVALAVHQAQLYGELQQAYDDLRQTQQAVMQQERLRALGQMASGIAHDINNAISPVALYTESLLEREPNLSPRTREYLTTIQHAIDDVAQTVSRMREFYRQREPQLTLAPVDLNRLVQQVAELTRARWSDMTQQRGVVIEMQSQLAQGLPAIMGVESEIREALINLIFNAVDAMTEGGVLTLRTRATTASPVAAPRESAADLNPSEFAQKSAALSRDAATASQDCAMRVHVEVCDTGVGMDEETQRRCMEPFFTTKGERGTGLGLAMVYGVVQRHSAAVEIESVLGQGTTVRLSFIASTRVSESPAPTQWYALPSRLRILIVDDDPLLIKSLRDTLESDGHRVVTANGGQAGIDAFRAAQQANERFAAVITDLGMPYVDGRKVASEVKSMSPSIPVILLTGWGRRLVAEGDVPAHVDRVLNKPPKLHELRTALSDLTAASAQT